MNPSVTWDDFVCPYKIASKIMVNNDGTVNYVSTILGHTGSKTDLKPQRTPERGNLKLSRQEQLKLHQLLKQNISLKQPVKKQQLQRTESTAVPPRNIRRPAIMLPATLPSLDSTDNPDDDYENQWPSEQFKRNQELEITASIIPGNRKPAFPLSNKSSTKVVKPSLCHSSHGISMQSTTSPTHQGIPVLKPKRKAPPPPKKQSSESKFDMIFTEVIFTKYICCVM